MTSPTAAAAARGYAAPWPAPTASGPVCGSVVVPGSKSATNRALVLAALATGPSVIRQPLVARDTGLMATGLTALGAEVDVSNAEAWRVIGNPGALFPRAAAVDCGLAGTVARFLPPIAALVHGSVTFDGDARMRERPMAPLLTALRALGVRLDDSGRGGLPVTVHGDGTPPRGGSVEVDASGSSQLVSGLLLAGARYADGVDVRHTGPAAPPSAPHLAMTVAMLRERGVAVDDTRPHRWQVLPGPIAPLDITVEPDLSSAAPYLAAAVVTGGSVTIADWPPATTQPGARLPELFATMGASCAHTPHGLTLTGPERITGIDADLHDVGELTPVIAAVAALARTPSRLTGIGHLRLHETDRLAALTAELAALGGRVNELPDGLEITPARLHGGLFRTYDDHRLAMAAAVLGLAVPGVLVENVATTAKTLPNFAETWLELVAP